MRTQDAANAAAMIQPNVRGIYFVKLAFDSGDICWHSGFGDIVFNGDTYIGVGNLSSISTIKEEPGVKASGASVGLSGVKEEIIALLLLEPYINRKAYIYFVPLDDGDQPVSATPTLIFKGTINGISGTQGSSPGFSVELKSRFADWERGVKILYTDVEQQQIHPGDRGMEYIAQLSQKKIIWPRAAFLPDPRD
ncbi:MAG: hypothetical protein HGA20_15000 [Geobacteraceae bacterium]|nr:hypothetical protein [Geobacteraceae bacterium]